MTKIKFIIGLFLFVNIFTICHSYDWDKCRREMQKEMRTGGPYGGLATTTTFPTQYISSWGGCSVTGKPEEDRKVFFNDNYDMLRRNFSENQGEYMYAFISYYKCSKDGETEFINTVRSNYQLIFGKIYKRTIADFIYPNNRSKTIENWDKSWDVTPKESFERLEGLILNNQSVGNECHKINSELK